MTEVTETDTTVGRREQRRQRRQLLSREQLLDAAEEIFGRKGYHETTLKEVAELAEFSVGSVYSFFDNKDDLFRQIFVRRGGQFMEGMRAVLSSTEASPLDQLHLLVDFEVQWFREHRHFGRLFLRHASASLLPSEGGQDEVILANYAEAMELQADVFRRGQAHGSLPTGTARGPRPPVLRDHLQLPGPRSRRRVRRSRADRAARTRRPPRSGRGHLQGGACSWLTLLTPRAPEGDWLGTPYLRFERHGVLARCIVDRPEARNALTPAMYFGIRYAIDHVQRDDELAGLLLTGTGDVFMPGGELGGRADDSWADLAGLLAMDNTPFDAVRRSVKPIVTAVNGLCQGGGLMIAMLSDVAVASERATFRAPELLRGIADTNYAQVLPRQIGPARARDMLLTGRSVDSATALEWGLVARVVNHDELLDQATAVLEQACRTAPHARAAVKRTLHEYYGHYDRMAMDASISGPEMKEGWLSFKERRSPSWVPEPLRQDERL